VTPAAGRLRVVVTGRRLGTRRAVRVRRSVLPASSGRFALSIRLPSGLRPRTVSVQFPGSATLAPRTVTRPLA
jgi:hypothetical protein